MAGYVDFPFAEDSDLTFLQIMAAYAQKFPGWTPHEGALEVIEAEEYGRVASEIKQLVVSVAAAAFRDLGVKLHKYPKLVGDFAEVNVAIAFSRDGFTLPTTFRVYGTTASGDEVAFQLNEPLTVRPSTANPAVVTMTAVEVGERSNELPAGELNMATVAPYITSVTAFSKSAGGIDPETDEQYLDRFSQYLTTLGGALVLPEDYAIRSRDIQGVYRALAVDGYNAQNQTSNNARTITVFPVTEEGAPVDEAVANELRLYLASQREINFNVFVAEPTYTPVTVTFTAVADMGYIASEVRAAVIERAYQFLSPGNFAGGSDEPPEWRNDKRIRFLQLTQVLGNVPGVAYLDDVKINGAEDDVILPGVAALPASRTATSPTVVTGTVS